MKRTSYLNVFVFFLFLNNNGYRQTKCYKQTDGQTQFTCIKAGADPGILVRGVDFFFKGMGSGSRFMPPVGPWQRRGGGPGGEAPGSSRILVYLEVKFNHIASPHR